VVKEKTNNKKIKPHSYIGKKDIEPIASPVRYRSGNVIKLSLFFFSQSRKVAEKRIKI